MSDAIPEIGDDSQLDKIQAIKAKEAQDAKQQPQPDASLTMTLQLLGPALQDLSKVEHHKGASVSDVSAQRPADLFASSNPKGAGVGASAPAAAPAGLGSSDAQGAGGASSFLNGVGSGANPLSSSGTPTSPQGWQDELQSMLKALKGMKAGAAINYITQKLLPFLGSYKQWQMSQEGVTMNAITEMNKDWSELKGMYDGSSDNQVPTAPDGRSAVEIMLDINSIATNPANGLSALTKGGNGSLIDNALNAISGNAWVDAGKDKTTIDESKLIQFWQSDWNQRGGGTSSQPSGSPDSTVVDGFSQFTTQLNNQSSGAQGEFKQDNSDYNTFNQVLTQTLKDITSQYNYFNQKMTGG